MRTIGVLGAGSWGTALAVHLCRLGHDVRLWARDPALVHDMRVRRANAVYLPDITLPEKLAVTAVPSWLFQQSRLMVVVP
jgi:glycerol-3-phosphate dehydrogenase (NAD(P)+)